MTSFGPRREVDPRATRFAQELMRVGSTSGAGRRRQEIAAYARAVAGSKEDLDPELEHAGISRPTMSRAGSTRYPRAASMPMYPTQQKEQFSIAYLRAVVAVAGYNIASVDVDEDSIDIGLRGNRRDGTFRKAPVLDVQAKCTATDDGGGGGPYLPVDLSIKNYDDLRESSRHVPLILVVVCVPPDLGDWLEETPEHTAMRRCAYWLSVRGQPPTTNTTTCRVQLPRSQRFTVDAVRTIMNRLGEGGAP